MIKLIRVLFFTTSLYALEIGDTLPDFNTQTSDGAVFNTQTISGAPALFIFWATWCPVCKEEIPHVQEIYDTFSKQGLKVLAVNVGINDSEKRMKKFKKKYTMNYPVAFDANSVITKRFGILGTPTVVIVDSNGIVRYLSAELPKELGAHFSSLKK